MRDKFHFSQLSQSLTSLTKNLVEDQNQSAEIPSRIVPSAIKDFENDYILKDRSFNTLVGLSILYWYLPEEISSLLRLVLEREWKHCENRVVGDILLNSKSHMLNFLCETSLWHSRDFFGNIFNKRKIKYLLRVLKPRLRKTGRPKRLIRHRGYRDKGTLRLDSDRHSFWEVSEKEMMQLEEKKQIYNDTQQFLLGFLDF